ncbi:hypothetical protein IRZ83_05385 [Flavobacterium sp. JLP]|nr:MULTISPECIES: hypothetical protein [unclassified Flavobacterium]MBF4492070.1 hypothetical protein [Flavobacterium sp. MR2016-29]MBF4506094.1 hypothetical protein [Flavobacterium sp. JLP]
MQTSITYFYLIIAQIIWPVWVQSAILLTDTVPATADFMRKVNEIHK